MADLLPGRVLVSNAGGNAFDITQPDAAGLEQTSNKDQPGGYVGINASGEVVGTFVVRTGTSAFLNGVVLADGEWAKIDGTNELRIGDGVTAGGQPPLFVDAPIQEQALTSAFNNTLAHNGRRVLRVTAMAVDQSITFRTSVTTPIQAGSRVGQQLTLVIVLEAVSHAGTVASAGLSLGASTGTTLADSKLFKLPVVEDGATASETFVHHLTWNGVQWDRDDGRATEPALGAVNFGGTIDWNATGAVAFPSSTVQSKYSLAGGSASLTTETAAFAWGQNCWAAGFASMATGHMAVSPLPGQRAFSSGPWSGSTSGCSQACDYHIYVSLAAGTSGELVASSSVGGRLTIPLKGTWAFEGVVVARRRNGGDEVKAWHVRGAITRDDAGTCRLVGTPQITFYEDAAMSGVGLTVAADNAGHALSLTGSCPAGIDAVFNAYLRTSEIIG